MQNAFLIATAVFLETVTLSRPALSQTLTVNWEVENRFRFYKNAETFKYYASIASANLDKGRDNWILNTENDLQDKYKNFAPSQFFPSVPRDQGEQELLSAWNGWASVTRDETCWDRQGFGLASDGRCDDYVSPVSHIVIASVAGAEPGARCQWMINAVGEPKFGDVSLWRRRARANATLASPRDCSSKIAIEVPYAADDSAYSEIKVRLIDGGTPRESETQKVLVKDILVLGMGDSFAAGVGNPDKPARISPFVAISYWNSLYNRPGNKLLPVRLGGDDNPDTTTNRVYDSQSEWLDIRCFRSQYGPQFRSALHLAVELRHAAVTYLDLACNGGRIIEGLLNEKKIDSGYSKRISENPPKSQIGEASRLLCADRSRLQTINYTLHPARNADDCARLGPREICEFADDDGEIVAGYQNVPGLMRTAMNVCGRDGNRKFSRPIDVLLLSIGGNDIGFAPMVADVIIDDKKFLINLVKRMGVHIGQIHSGSVGLQRLALLRSKYEVLDAAITSYLPLHSRDKKPIFLTPYPMPIDDASGKLCGSNISNIKSANAALDMDSVFTHFPDSTGGQNRNAPPLTRLASVGIATCALNLHRFAWFDGGSNASSIVDLITKSGGLCEGQSDLAKPNAGERNLGWQYVSEVLEKFRGHGFCSYRDGEDPATVLSIPAFQTGADVPWKPNLEQMRPYLSRQRWLRTPNDALVITNWQTGALRLNDMLNMGSAATTTAMHPTAEGYAAVADALLDRVSRFLCAERKPALESEPLCAVH